MKIITITTILILTLISPITILCDFVTDDGIKVQLFKSKSKKPIPLKSYNLVSKNDYGFQEYGITVSEPIEKIVLNGKFEDNLEDLSYRVTVINTETNKIVLFKDEVTFGYDVRTYSLPLIPWIENKGKYKIMIERNNMLNVNDNRMLFIQYVIE